MDILSTLQNLEVALTLLKATVNYATITPENEYDLHWSIGRVEYVFNELINKEKNNAN